jgi:hypothetical protein
MHEIGRSVKLFRGTGLLIIALLFQGCAGTQQATTATAAAPGSSTPTSSTASTTGTPASGSSTPPTPATSPSPGGSSSNAAAAITLQGVPPTSAAVGTGYAFQPAVSPGSAGVTFAATGLPAWLSFNANTGALSGTPAVKDEGTTGHITISATNGSSRASLTPFTIQVKGMASAMESIKLSWAAPTKNADGTPVTDLAGYHIYYGPSANELTKKIDVAGAASTAYVVAGLTSGTYYFSLVAYNSAGLDSGRSNITDLTI